MNRSILITVAIIVVVIIAGAFLLNSGSLSNSTDTTSDTFSTNSTNQNQNQNQNDAATSQVKSFTVTSRSFSFTPATMTVNKGDRVRITLNNVEGFHDFKLDEFNVATKRIQGAGQETVEFVADRAGTFEYYCSVGNHRAMGMKGTLTVTE